MSQILVVHDDAALRVAVRSAVEKKGHRAFEARDGLSALGWAKTSPLDLVVADLRLRAPDAVETRMAIRRVAATPKHPFIFVDLAASRDGTAVSRLAENEDLHLLRGPGVEARIPSLVEALLGDLRRIEGGFADDSFERLLLRIEGGRENGVLTAFRGTVVKKIVFHEGSIAFAGSNDPRELIGQSFVSAGLITEAELKEAMAQQSANHEPLAKVLQKVSRVSREQADDAVRRKFEECLLDVFLWADGGWTYSSALPGAPPENALHIPLGALRVEGLRRRGEWKALSQKFPSEEVRVELVDARRAASTEPDRKMISLLT
ncbi:MAG TPA: response regulator, partial [bacterium]|nr:response regulator [bacterium]